MQVEVTTWYLEMLSAEQARPIDCPTTEARLERIAERNPGLNRWLYSAVGNGWYWTQRLPWDDAAWADWVQRPEVETLVLYVGDEIAGYVELAADAAADGNVEISYFGLIPGFIGRRLGGYLLSAGIERAWARGAQRVWVHTCSLDGPHALANYQARGFRVYETETMTKELP